MYFVIIHQNPLRGLDHFQGRANSPWGDGADDGRMERPRGGTATGGAVRHRNRSIPIPSWACSKQNCCGIKTGPGRRWWGIVGVTGWWKRKKAGPKPVAEENRALGAPASGCQRPVGSGWQYYSIPRVRHYTGSTKNIRSRLAFTLLLIQ